MEELWQYVKKFDDKAVFVAIFLLGVIFYANTFNNQLFWDDYDSIVNNAYIQDWKFVPKYFSENLTSGAGVANNYWRPLLLFSFSLDYHIGELNPFFYHLQNLSWHILGAFLVYLLTFKIFKNKLAGFLASLLFLLHPLQTEAVTYVAGRADPMHAALMLLSFLFFYKYASEKAGMKWHIWSLLFFTGALLTKERAIIFPALIILYYLTLYREPIFQNWKKKACVILPYAGIAMAFLILRMTILHFTDTFDWGQPNNIGAENWYYKFLAYCKGVAVYAGLLIFPAKLYMEKSISIPQSFFDAYVISGLALIAGSAAGIVRSFRREKIFAFGMLWFWIAFSPSFHVYPIQGLLYEHWLYFPLVGIFMVVSLKIAELIQLKKGGTKSLVAAGIIVFIVLSLGTRTIIRNNDWDNPVRFYEKNVALGGVSARVYTNLGMAYDDAKRHNEAVETYKKAIESDGRLFQPWYDMGNSYNDAGKTEEAIQAYQKSAELNPHFFPAYYNLAGIYANNKKYEKAIDILEKLLIISPDNQQSLYNLGIVYYQKGDKSKAKKYLKRVLEADPHNLDLIRLVNSL